MVPTEQEHQLIECISPADPDEFSVTVSRGNGASEIDMSAGKRRAAASVPLSTPHGITSPGFSF
jgi:hypothetical protein